MANVHIQAFSVIILLGIIYCLQIIPERINVTYFDPKYVEYFSVYIKRYGRNSPYYCNVDARSKHTWNNNITFHFIFYEYLHHEYRRSFVEMHYKFCDLINEPIIGLTLASNGVICPAPPREYHLVNMTALTNNFPNVFPFEKGRMEVEICLTDTGESIGRVYVNAIFKNINRKRVL